MRTVTDADRIDYERDGYVVIRDVVDATMRDSLRDAIDDCRARPSTQYRELSVTGTKRVDSDLFRAGDTPAIAALARHRALVDLAMDLLSSPDGVVFVEDQWFASEPGSATASPWHQDSPYYAIDRPFLTVWFPIDPVPPGAELAVVPGSHRWNRHFAPVEFSANASTLAAGDSRLEPVPDVDQAAVRHTDAVPGDVVVFDARLLHSAGGPVGTPFRRFSIRYASRAARYVRPSWPVAGFWDELPHGLRDGEPLECAVFPLVGAGSGAVLGSADGSAASA